MLGRKLYKNNEQDMQGYTECAEYCNVHNYRIIDKGEYYEVVENVIETDESHNDNTPSLEQRINDLELALIELAGE